MTREEMLNEIIKFYGIESSEAIFFAKLITCEVNEENDDCVEITYKIIMKNF